MDKNIIKAVARAHGLTMKDVVNRVGVSEPAFYKSLRADCRVSTIERIAEAIGVSPAEFYEPTSTPQANTQGVKCPHCGKPLTITVE